MKGKERRLKGDEGVTISCPLFADTFRRSAGRQDAR